MFTLFEFSLLVLSFLFITQVVLPLIFPKQLIIFWLFRKSEVTVSEEVDQVVSESERLDKQKVDVLNKASIKAEEASATKKKAEELLNNKKDN